MADKEGNVLAKDYGIGIAPPERPFPVKGHASAGWPLTMAISWALPQVWNVLI